MRGVALLLLVMTSAPAGTAAAAGGDDDSAALSLPRPGAAAAAGTGPVSLTAEAALTHAAERTGGEADAQRLSYDIRIDSVWLPGWRITLGDRLDLDWQDPSRGSQRVNTLKQAYVSWQARPDLLFDAGRINARQGVAYGYNPTDLFRADALRTVDSLDPGSLRDNRLGAVMIREESLWDSGAFTASYAPRLADTPGTAPFDPDWGATNSKTRWLLSLTQRINGASSPQWLLSGADAGSPQLGMNLTSVLGSSIVSYLEASAGRALPLWAQALALPGTRSFRTRAAAGLTYSTNNRLSVTLEYEYDGAALGSRGWDAARHGDLRSYGIYRKFVGAQQELPTRHSAFMYASWQDVFAKHLDLSGFVRVDLIDHSRLPWTELRYHWSHGDAALQFQDYLGGATTDYGAAPSRQIWQLLLDYYL